MKIRILEPNAMGVHNHLGDVVEVEWDNAFGLWEDSDRQVYEPGWEEEGYFAFVEEDEEPQDTSKQYVLVSRMGYKDYVGTLEEILEYASDNNVDILQERVFELGEEVKLKVVVESDKL